MKGSCEREVHECSAGSTRVSCRVQFGTGSMGNGLGGIDDNINNDESLDARRENAADFYFFICFK